MINKQEKVVDSIKKDGYHVCTNESTRDIIALTNDDEYFIYVDQYGKVYIGPSFEEAVRLSQHKWK